MGGIAAVASRFVRVEYGEEVPTEAQPLGALPGWLTR